MGRNNGMTSNGSARQGGGGASKRFYGAKPCWGRGFQLGWIMAFGLMIIVSYKNLQILSADDAPLQVQPKRMQWEQREQRVKANTDTGDAVLKKPSLQTSSSVEITSPLQDKGEKPFATIAHAISFLDCGYSLTEKYKDAMLVLRHSIHQNSWHNVNSISRYSYQMYAFVNNDPETKCPKNVEWIQRMGYTPLLLPNPINVTSISNKFYRETIDQTGVTGSSELIKLYLYTLTDHPIACHWDIDVIIQQPMDDIFDAMLYDESSTIGKEARSLLKIQQPLHQRVPKQIDGYFTRDIALAVPWRTKQVSQGGFTIVRPNRTVFEHYLQVVHAANYSARCDNRGGWGNLGYGCQQGAMHYQGVVAYYYDHIHPGPGGAVELDVCVWNQIAHSVVFHTGKKKQLEYNGMCRQYPIYGGSMEKNRPEFGACHDCRVYPVEETRTIHYTACFKPWQCKHFPQNDSIAAASAVINATTCGLLHREFFLLRQDLEEQLVQSLGEGVRTKKHVGSKAYYPEYFLGYCKNAPKLRYKRMNDLPESFEMKQLYGF